MHVLGTPLIAPWLGLGPVLAIALAAFLVVVAVICGTALARWNHPAYRGRHRS